MRQPRESRGEATDAAWGAYRPSLASRYWLSLCHRLSDIKPLRQLALWTRRPLKYRRPAPMDITLWGLKLRLFPQGNLAETRMLFTPGLFDKKERLLIRRFVRKGCTVVDIGANVGGYSFWVYSILKKDCRIYAVEPDPELQRRLTFNIAANHAETITLVPLALSDVDGTGTFQLNGANKGQNQLIETGGPDRADTIAVPVSTLLSVVQANGITAIDVMKIDVEGHERQILEPFFAAAEKRLWPAMLLIEEFPSKDSAALSRRLQDLGYRPHLKTTNNRIYYYSAA